MQYVVFSPDFIIIKTSGIAHKRAIFHFHGFLYSHSKRFLPITAPQKQYLHFYGLLYSYSRRKRSLLSTVPQKQYLHFHGLLYSHSKRSLLIAINLSSELRNCCGVGASLRTPIFNCWKKGV